MQRASESCCSHHDVVVYSNDLSSGVAGDNLLGRYARLTFHATVSMSASWPSTGSSTASASPWWCSSSSASARTAVTCSSATACRCRPGQPVLPVPRVRNAQEPARGGQRDYISDAVINFRLFHKTKLVVPECEKVIGSFY
ncbi:unnamed protein product [Phytophthora fragariaefolia]|uniref:Unnamed protein product n=1 Tax=Phytophthora fragariaefolia TaxID=1490495 RepID=A0A9W6XHT3_9STRA|nr:unnamed protein product [Phytophthora fragariaefolia]